MRKFKTCSVMGLGMALVFSAGLMAQEQTELSIQVKKDGKVVKDTTYRFEDDSDARHVLKMVEVMSGMDGEMDRIKELHGDSLVWISEGDEPHEAHMKGGNVVIISGDEKGNWTSVSSDNTDIDDNEEVYFISEDDDVHVKLHKIVEEDEDGEHIKVIVIKKENDDDAEHDVDLDHEADHDKEVKVKVIKKKVKVENE